MVSTQPRQQMFYGLSSYAKSIEGLRITMNKSKIFTQHAGAKYFSVFM